MYDTFQNTNVWHNMNKAERRKLNKKAFIEKIQKNLFLRNNYRPAKSYFKGIRLTKPFVVGYKIRVEDDDEEVEVSI